MGFKDAARCWSGTVLASWSQVLDYCRASMGFEASGG
jgi:hypothetical protein